MCLIGAVFDTIRNLTSQCNHSLEQVNDRYPKCDISFRGDAIGMNCTLRDTKNHVGLLARSDYSYLCGRRCFVFNYGVNLFEL